MIELDKDSENILNAKDALITLMNAYLHIKKQELWESGGPTIEELQNLIKKEQHHISASDSYAIDLVYPMIKKMLDEFNPPRFLFESEEDYARQQSEYDKYLGRIFSFKEALEKRKPFLWKVVCPECRNNLYLPNDHVGRRIYCPTCGVHGIISGNLRTRPSEFLTTLAQIAPGLRPYTPDISLAHHDHALDSLVYRPISDRIICTAGEDHHPNSLARLIGEVRNENA